MERAKEGKSIDRNPSIEYGSSIVDSVVTDNPCKIYGNVMNTGLITNLPEFSSVEVACLVDSNGVKPCHYGELPTQLASLCRMEINAHQLAVEAILNKNRKAVKWALMMDPATHSILTLDEIEKVVDELVAKQEEYLGEYL